MIGRLAGKILECCPDRVVLDLPEPWHSVPIAAKNLAPGGIFSCYLPTVPQVQQVREALDTAGAFLDIMTFEVMMREWTV